MAENQAQKKARLAAEAKAAESQVFGAGQPPVPPQVDPLGIVTPPVGDQGNQTQSQPLGIKPEQSDGITISRDQFESMMSRMSDLETIAMSASRPNDPASIFNPLAEVKENRTLNVVFHGDLLVTGYKETERPNGTIQYAKLEKNEDNMIRTFVTLLLTDIETGDTSEEKVDLLDFLEAATPMLATIKDRKDIGGIVEHGLVNQMRWDGKTLVPTDTKIMTGARIQKFLFTVELAGKTYQMTEQVVNIKS